MKKIKDHKCHGGSVQYWEHDSTSTGTPMTFSVFLPPAAASGEKLKTLYWLSGLTCTADNFTSKGHCQEAAAKLGVIVIAPDTSPRGAGIAGEDDSYDLGTGAGFYVDATEEPWVKNYRMDRYITKELYQLALSNFAVDPQRIGIAGHSMGGHGALVLGMRNPDKFKTISAFAPICAPSNCPWGKKALSAYLGADPAGWQDYDASVLINKRGFPGPILVDQGGADEFLAEQLQPDTLQAAAKESGAKLEVRVHEGYDHSYFFIQSFFGDHLKFHCDNL